MHAWKKKTVDAKLGTRLFLAPLFLQHRHQLLRCRHWLIFKGPLSSVVAPDSGLWFASCPLWMSGHYCPFGEWWIPSFVAILLLPLSVTLWNRAEGKLESDFSRILAECWHRFPLSQCSRQQIAALRIGEAVIPSICSTLVCLWCLHF